MPRILLPWLKTKEEARLGASMVLNQLEVQSFGVYM